MRDQLLELYRSYGFEVGECQDDAVALISEGGYFRNVEVVQLSESSQNAEKIKDDYVKIGYSARILKYKSIEETHEVLFDGFFKAACSNKKLLQEYQNFCTQQSKSLCHSTYEYISGAYLMDNRLEKDGLISRVTSMLTEDSNTARLIILEAAAGYGKTCTSFEIVANILNVHLGKVPMLAELSKNRKAAVFKYVLLSEIDKHFPTLSSPLVISEIKTGRVPLIIDGFDELLSRGNVQDMEENSASKKDAQTMLDTIAQLLHDNSCAKILLTTRRSSFISGEIFAQFIENQLGNCNAVRIQLMQPNISHWLGYERIDLLNRLNIDIKCISSPVLLNMLRNEPLNGYEIRYTTIDDILEQYLGLLLEREQTRQSIPIKKEEQLAIMEKLAANMVELDISSEGIDFIRLIIEEIIADKIQGYIERFRLIPSSNGDDGKASIATEEELIGALSHHALLDRISYNENRIGFLNEFIFGVMISNATINDHLAIETLTGKYLDIALTASANRSLKHKKALSNNIKPIINNVPPEQQLLADICLTSTLTRDYEGQYWDGIYFDSSFVINGEYSFKNCIFSGCTFNKTIICTEGFLSCQFYNCQFFDLRISHGETTNCELVFAGCSGHEEFASVAQRQQTEEIETVNYQRMVLEQFWKPGYDLAEPRKAPRTLFKGISQSDKKYISEAIKELVNKGILVQGVYSSLELSFDKIGEIRKICGRG